MLLVFDLDGVLVDTREANLRAYLSVGVAPPHDFHVLPWETWTDKETHDKKNDALAKHSDLVRRLPLLDLALQRRAPVLTSASYDALEIVRTAIPPLRLLHMNWELRPESKLNALRALGETGVYFDDSGEFCRRVVKETRWQAVVPVIA